MSEETGFKRSEESDMQEADSFRERHMAEIMAELRPDPTYVRQLRSLCKALYDACQLAKGIVDYAKEGPFPITEHAINEAIAKYNELIK